MVEVKCPKCGVVIERLYYSVKGMETADFTINEGTGTAEYDWNDYSGEGEKEYSCPECGEVVATTEFQAKMILRGE